MRRAEKVDPLDPAVLARLAEAEFKTGTLETATEVAKTNMQWNGETIVAQLSMAEMEIRSGNYSAGHRLLLTASNISPDSFELQSILSQFYLDVGMDDEAYQLASGNPVYKAFTDAQFGDREAVEDFLTEAPTFDGSGDGRGAMYYFLGDLDAALPHVQNAVATLEVTGPADLGMHEATWALIWAHVLVNGDDPDGEVILRKIERRLEGLTPDNTKSRDAFVAGAGVELLRGNQDRAVDWLEAAFENGHVFMRLVRRPIFAPLSNNARFQALSAEMEVRAAGYRSEFSEQIQASLS